VTEGAKKKEPPLPGRRVVVIGTSGSGKTTMARNLGKRLKVPHIELDYLHWGPNWTEQPNDIMREGVLKALDGRDGWTVCGNYSHVQDIIWARADTVVWLDYSLPLILWRLTRRTFGRAVLNEEIWHGNKENLHTHLFTKDSLYWWVLTTYKRRRKQVPEWFRDPRHAHLKKIRLRTARAANNWLARVTAGTGK
jgi:adenylate kinase family enzyme